MGDLQCSWGRSGEEGDFDPSSLQPQIWKRGKGGYKERRMKYQVTTEIKTKEKS